MSFLKQILTRIFKIPRNSTQILADFDLTRGGQEIATPSGYDDYARTYTQESWVYACVSLIIDTCATVPFSVFAEQGDELKKLPDHPLTRLLTRPHPKLSRFELWAHTIGSLELAGQAYWYLIKNSYGEPIQIMPLFPHRVAVVPSKDEFIAGYLYTVEEETISLEAEEVICFKRWHPLDEYYGLSGIEAGALATSTDLYAQVYNRTFFSNNARPAGLLKTEQRLSQQEVDELLKRWEISFKGVTRSHKIAILGRGLEYQPIGISPKDAEFLAQREFSRDEILSVFRVPASLLGLYNRYRATTESDERNFMAHTIKPKLTTIAEKITAELLPMFDYPHPIGARLVGKFDDVVPQNLEEQRLRDEIDLKYGVLTPDEVRARRYGLSPRDKEIGK
jgi:HK97 family phage portal protein